MQRLRGETASLAARRLTPSHSLARCLPGMVYDSAGNSGTVKGMSTVSN
jgi:hypothetical protein